MSGSKSRRKGKRGERQAARLLSELTGKEWRRSQQVKGTQESSDIEPANGSSRLWPEVKRDESTISKKMYTIMKTAGDESGNKIPFLMSRRNREKWLFIIDEDNLIEFCKEMLRRA